MGKILSIKNLKYSYDNVFIFDGLNLTIEENTVNAIIGPNNCGKTTLIKLLSGLLPTNNCIYFDNQSINKKSFRQYSLNIGVALCNNKNNFLFEDVISELVFSLENLRWEKKKIAERLKYVADVFTMNDFLDKKIDELNNIEIAKLSLAQTLMHKPKIVFLDNVFDFLSNDEYIEIIETLRILIADEKITVVYTTNSLNQTMLSDNIFVLNDKCLCLQGNVDEILKHDNLLAKIGIEIPIMIDLSLKLKFYQLLNDVETDPRRLIDILWK